MATPKTQIVLDMGYTLDYVLVNTQSMGTFSEVPNSPLSPRQKKKED